MSVFTIDDVINDVENLTSIKLLYEYSNFGNMITFLVKSDPLDKKCSITRTDFMEYMNITNSEKLQFDQRSDFILRLIELLNLRIN
jgi:hypothetical protein